MILKLLAEKQVIENSVGNIPLKKKRGRSSSSPFPRNTLKRALDVAEAIEKNNAGQPFDRLDVAKCVEYSPNASGFRTLIISSGRYGLTTGGYKADKIGLTSLGSAIVAPTADDDPKASTRQALTTPEVFKNIYEKFNKKNIPREDVFKSTLKKEFGITPEDVDVCYKVIIQNAEEMGAIQDFKGNKFLNLDKIGEPLQIANIEEENAIEGVEQFEEMGDVRKESDEGSGIVEKKKIAKVFISHSKNEHILEQIKDMLEFGEFEFIVAEEEESTAIPIPDKVFGHMRNCNCAIINASADDENKQEDGTYRINENVLIEIGGAFVYYNKRVILLVDKRIELPSNLQGLYICQYEGDDLSWDISKKLRKALVEFKKSL